MLPYYLIRNYCKMTCFYRMEQIVEKELQKKKEEEETRKLLQERDEALRKQIEIEQERLKTKEIQMKVRKTWYNYSTKIL